MALRRIVNGELRAYINWKGVWRHVYILSSQDNTNLIGETVRMINFKLTKNSKDILQAEKMKFQKKKPATRSGRKGVEA